MNRTRSPHALSPTRIRWMLNLYPPMLFNRARVVEWGLDPPRCTVRVKPALRTRNLQGSMFGGTIYAAADPFYPMLYWQVLAHRGMRVQAWLKSGRARYLRPAATALTLRFTLSEDDVAQAETALAAEGRFARTHAVEAIDTSGVVCATVEAEVYLRRPRPKQRETSAF